MQKGNEFRVHGRRVFKRIFYVLFDRLKIRRFRDHLFRLTSTTLGDCR
jgi:hypothetical protein